MNQTVNRIVNQTAVNQTAVNQTAVNQTAVNQKANQENVAIATAKASLQRRVSSRPSVLRTLQDDAGQATVEYALVMLGAAAVAGMLLAWAVGSGLIDQLMTTVIDSVISDATPPVP